MTGRLLLCGGWTVLRAFEMTPAVARIFVVFLLIGLELGFLDEGVDASSKGAFSMKSSPSDTANEYCSGYTDRHGQWNNGFSCPKWGRPDQVYCCGSEHHRYCCPSQRETLTDDATNGFHSHGPLLAGLTVAALLTITFLLVASCYCCPCCVIYKRRKSRLQDRSSDSIDWQLGATTPIRYEIAASAAATSSNIDLRPPNPPPYDDKDAPPKYSSVCGVTTDRPMLPYNGSYNYSRPHAAAGHSSSCAEPTPSAAPQAFVKKQYFDVIGQQPSHVIGKHGHVINKQAPATGQQIIGQRNHVVGHVICQNGQRKFSRPSYHDPTGRGPEQDAVAGGRPNGYQGGGSSSTLLSPQTPIGARGGGGTSQNDDSHWRNDGDLQTSNYELCGGVH